MLDELADCTTETQKDYEVSPTPGTLNESFRSMTRCFQCVCVP